MKKCAILSNQKVFTSFSYNDLTIRFRTSEQLERYTKILEWDKGYLVVMAQYKNHPEKEEKEYIDLIPILDNLYIDADQFLAPISEVKIENA